MPVRQIQPSRAGTVPWPDEFIARYTERGWWQGRSLGALIQAAADAPGNPVRLVDGDLEMTGRELMRRADGAALRLRALGLRPDDRIVLALPNTWEFVVLTVACLRLGVLPVMALPAHRRHELTSVAAMAEARAIAVPRQSGDVDLGALARQITAESDTLEHVLVLGDRADPEDIDLRALCAPAGQPDRARADLDAAAPDPRSVALFLLSGGTTGTPKLIARTHEDYACMIRLASRICGFGPDTVYLAVLPLGHGFPMAGPGALGALIAGGRVVLAATPAPDRAFAAIERHRPTVTSLVPAVVQRWLEHRAADARHDISSLSLVQVGGSRLPEHLARRIGPELGCALQQVYGMGEGLLCLTRLDDPPEVALHTQGRPVCPDDELLFLGPDGAPVPPGVPGVLLTRGPYTPRGYYRAEELNAAAFSGGWYRTGDVVLRRPDGNLVIEGRDKDVINRGGEKVFAPEVEALAALIPGLGRVAAVAMPDPELGERVCLYAVPADGAAPALAAVRSALERAGLARFKLPDRLILVDALPSTSVGKVDKQALRADLAARPAPSADPRGADR